MASFDIESLFTSFPLQKTIQNCVQKLKLFSGNQSVPGFTRDLLKNFLEHAVIDSFFVSNEAYYTQVEGLRMALPLGPTLANMFMCHHEGALIRDCPAAFAPAKYLRYIDDTCGYL